MDQVGIISLAATTSLAILGFISKSIWDCVYQNREQKRIRKLQELDHLIQDFYNPLYTKLQREQLIWDKLIHLYNSDVNREIIKRLDDGTLARHVDIQELILNNSVRANPPRELKLALTKYDRHVTLYKALRETGSYAYPVSLGCPFPRELSGLVHKRLKELEIQRKVLLSLCPGYGCKPKITEIEIDEPIENV